MSNARNLSKIITGNFDVPLGALDNVPPSNDASALTTGTLPIARIAGGAITADKIGAGVITPIAVSDQANTSTGSLSLPNGTTAQRPASSVVGELRYNTSYEQLEMYDGSDWAVVKSSFAATGGTITTSEGYRYHTFTSSGTLIVTKGSVVADYLIVAGGGGGGGRAGGGGGAGGYLFGSTSISVGSLSIIVGAGGFAGPPDAYAGYGANSVALGFTAIGGGRSAGGDNFAGSAGGSGGGGSYNGAGGAGTTGQGFAGGGSTATNYNNGGGGGASEVGETGTSSYIGSGGDGKQWLNGTYYAGGGGGGGHAPNSNQGYGGLGGGGDGGLYTTWDNGDPGVANTGGGGGGATSQGSGTNTGGAGGSGIVIIRYAI